MKCSFRNCKEKAEFVLPYDRKKGYCSFHAVEVMNNSKFEFMPRV